MSAGIYEIVNRENDHRYVGSAVNVNHRLATHRSNLRRGKHPSHYLQSAWNKYGTDSFALKVLLVCDKHNLLFFEQRAIDTLKPCYNTAPRAESSLGIKRTQETRAKMSAALMGNTNGLGHEVSPEARAKMSAANMGNPSRLGHKNSPEMRARISAAKMGHKASPEARAKISAAMMGNTNSLGYKHTPEARANMSEARKRWWAEHQKDPR